MAFLSNSDQDFNEMLKAIGVSSFEELIANIPENLRFKGNLNLPEALSEWEVTQLLHELSAKNQAGISFLGGGTYDHFVPAAVEQIISRPEFYTAYTPYQPEVSQGTLQAIYEFQSLICELTRMDVTNASMYDGGSALAEAMLLAYGHTRRHKILYAVTLNPTYQQILNTYSANNEIELLPIESDGFHLDINDLKSKLDDQVAAVIVQHPNFFGFFEDVLEIGELLKDDKALFIVHYDPISLGLLAPPGEYGADIAIAEGQPLGVHLNYGGPYLGLFSAREALVRKMPGRIIGVTRDVDGRRGFVMTLQTREQHIRREKATSNICTNSGLMALAAAVYLSLMGRSGMEEVGNLCLQKAHYLYDELINLPGVEKADDVPFFKEFTVRMDGKTKELLRALKAHKIYGGLDLESYGYQNHLLIAVTEKRSRQQLDQYIEIAKKVMSG